MSEGERAKILAALEDGNSLRSTCLMTNHSFSTVRRVALGSGVLTEQQRKVEKSWPIDWPLKQEIKFLNRMIAGACLPRGARRPRCTPCEAVRRYRDALPNRFYGLDGKPMTSEVREALMKHCELLLGSKGKQC
jgi:hypothetical protein